MEYIWDIFGIYLGYILNIFGIYLGYIFRRHIPLYCIRFTSNIDFPRFAAASFTPHSSFESSIFETTEATVTDYVLDIAAALPAAPAAAAASAAEATAAAAATPLLQPLLLLLLGTQRSAFRRWSSWRQSETRKQVMLHDYPVQQHCWLLTLESFHPYFF